MFRRYDSDGRMAEDTLGLEGERLQGEVLLVPVMRGGRRIHPAEPLGRARARSRKELERLPDALKSLEAAPPYVVNISQALRSLAHQLHVQEVAAVKRQELECPALPAI